MAQTRAERRAQQKQPLFTGQLYDIIKRLGLYGLPAIGAFWYTIAEIWNLPAQAEVMGTIAALNVLINALWVISRKRYLTTDAAYDGKFVVDTTDPEKDTVSLQLNGNPLDLLTTKDSVSLRVDDQSAPSQ